MKMKHATIKNATLDLGKIRPYIGEDGTFEVPDDIGLDVLDRLKSAGYKVIGTSKEADLPPAKVVDTTKTVEPKEAVATEDEPKAIALDDLTAIKGVGEKTAQKIINKYHDIPTLKACTPEKMAADIDGLTEDHAKELLAKFTE